MHPGAAVTAAVAPVAPNRVITVSAVPLSVLTCVASAGGSITARFSCSAV